MRMTPKLGFRFKHRQTGLLASGIMLAASVLGTGNATAQMPGVSGAMRVPAATVSQAQAPTFAPTVASPMPDFSSDLAPGEYIVDGPGSMPSRGPSYTGGSQCSPNACFAGCQPGWFGTVEALYLKRGRDENFSRSRNIDLGGFDYDLGSRFSFGRRWDCTNGWDFAYSGPFSWQSTGTATSTANALQSTLFTSDGVVPAQIDTFNNASLHTEDYRAKMHSYEINRRWFGWDLVSTLVGIRILDYREALSFNSVGSTGGVGVFAQETKNFLVGAQIGGDFWYPMSNRFSAGLRGRAGVFANFDSSQTFLSNNGTTLVNVKDTDVDVAGIIELGFLARYRILPSAHLIGGYQMWYVPGLATVPNQPVTNINPGTGNTVYADDSVFLHGANVGLEFNY